MWPVSVAAVRVRGVVRGAALTLNSEEGPLTASQHESQTPGGGSSRLCSSQRGETPPPPLCSCCSRFFFSVQGIIRKFILEWCPNPAGKSGTPSHHMCLLFSPLSIFNVWWRGRRPGVRGPWGQNRKFLPQQTVKMISLSFFVQTNTQSDQSPDSSQSALKLQQYVTEWKFGAASIISSSIIHWLINNG